jgi:hypothetical protein
VYLYSPYHTVHGKVESFDSVREGESRSKVSESAFELLLLKIGWTKKAEPFFQKIENSILFQMRPSSAFFMDCTSCHVQAELFVWRNIEKVESFLGWNSRGLYGTGGFLWSGIFRNILGCGKWECSIKCQVLLFLT